MPRNARGLEMCLSIGRVPHGAGVSPPHIYSETLHSDDNPAPNFAKRQTWPEFSRNGEFGC